MVLKFGMATTATPDVETETDTRTQRQPPYAVVLHNDDANTMPFVVFVLQKVFGYTLEKCFQIMAPAQSIKGLAADAKFDVVKSPQVSVWFVMYNLQDPAMKNVKFRQALNAAVNRQALNDQACEGLLRTSNSYLPPKWRWLRSSTARSRSRNQDAVAVAGPCLSYQSLAARSLPRRFEYRLSTLGSL